MLLRFLELTQSAILAKLLKIRSLKYLYEDDS